MSLTAQTFFKGLLSGLTAPMTAFSPEPIHTHIPDWGKAPSYKPMSDDWKAIQQDFERAFNRIRPKIDAAQAAKNLPH